MCKIKLTKIIIMPFLVLFLASSVEAEKAEFFKSKKHFNLTVTEEFDGNDSSYQRSLKRNLKFKIEKNGKEKIIDWNGHLHSITENIYTFNDKVLIECTLPMSGSSISGKTLLIIDTDKGIVQDTIRCFEYSLSPSKRFLVYRTWYPRMAPRELRKSIILSYDLSISAIDNRFSFANEFTYNNAGLPIFPEANAYYSDFDPNDIEEGHDIKKYNPNLDKDEYILTSHFLWSEDEQVLVFLVFNSSKQENYIIKINLSGGQFNPNISRKNININELIKWDVLLEDTKEELAKRGYMFSAKNISFGEGDTLILTPYKQYYLNEEIIMDLP